MTKKSIFLASLMCGLAALFYAYEDTLRVLPGTLAQHLFVDLHIDAKQLGFMAALFYIGYAPMQIPAGLLLDRFGPRRCLLVATMACAIATMVFAWTPLFWLLSVSRFWIGVASSVAYLASLMLAARWFDGKYFVFVVGCIQLLGCVGSLLGQAPVAWLLGLMSWRQVVLWLALLCALLTLLYYVLLRDAPGRKVMAASSMSMAQLCYGVGSICRQSQTWWVGLYAFFIWAPISVFAVLWGVSFFHVSYHMSDTSASILLSAIWIGVAVGGPLFGWCSQMLGRRCVLMAAAGVMGAVAAFVIVYDPGLPHGVLWCLLFLFGVASSAQAVSFGVVFDRHPKHLLGVATGFHNMAVVMGGFLLQPLVGIFLSHHAVHGGLGSVPVYDSQDFQYALWVLPACYLMAAALAWWRVQETWCSPTSAKCD
jgi:MFS family permease